MSMITGSLLSGLRRYYFVFTFDSNIAYIADVLKIS